MILQYSGSPPSISGIILQKAPGKRPLSMRPTASCTSSFPAETPLLEYRDRSVMVLTFVLPPSLFCRYVISLQYPELCPAVDLMGDLLLFIICQGVDILLRECHPGTQEGRILNDRGINHFGTAFAIAFCRQPVSGDTFANEIVYNSLGSFLREINIILFRVTRVSVRHKFDGHVGVIIEGLDKFIERDH